jgi:hypothetical protein
MAVMATFVGDKNQKPKNRPRYPLAKRLLQDLNLRGNLPIHFECITLTTRSNSRLINPSGYGEERKSSVNCMPYDTVTTKREFECSRVFLIRSKIMSMVDFSFF